MPSSITLTVSHLPSSASFFLSALQPLDYVYRGRADNTIGFGSGVNPSAPADFWISQEVPGVPAGAAHVAFPAPSRKAVQNFFLVALKAGAKIHGEPAVRDNSGYYSAAVIDFDGNSIEAVHRPTFSDDKENDARTVISTKTSKVPSVIARSAISKTAPSEVRSTASTSRGPEGSRVPAANPASGGSSGDFLDNFLDQARTAAGLARSVATHALPANPTPSGGANGGGVGEAVVGTLLGVAAGAALHAVFSNRNQSNDRPQVQSRAITEPVRDDYYYFEHPQYRAIEAVPSDYGRRFITLEDRDSGSAVRAPNLASRPRRNSSSDIHCPSFASRSSMSKLSRNTEQRMIEGPPSRTTPPTSYKAPSVLTKADTNAPGSSSVSRSSRRRSSSAHSHSRRSSHSRHTDRSSVHVTELSETLRQFSTTSKSKHGSKTGSEASTIKPAPSKASKAPSTLIREKEPHEFPLPPSRASTWVGSMTADSKASKSKSHHTSASKKSHHTFTTAPDKESSIAGKSNLTRSEVGKIKEMKTLDVTDDPVKPEDSVSQVSSVRSSRK